MNWNVIMAGAYERYFHFDMLTEKLHKIEDTILFGIICFLLYIWAKLFIYWDK